jgi:hypothetical protein
MMFFGCERYVKRRLCTSVRAYDDQRPLLSVNSSCIIFSVSGRACNQNVATPRSCAAFLTSGRYLTSMWMTSNTDDHERGSPSFSGLVLFRRWRSITSSSLIFRTSTTGHVQMSSWRDSTLSANTQIPGFHVFRTRRYSLQSLRAGIASYGKRQRNRYGIGGAWAGLKKCNFEHAS